MLNKNQINELKEKWHIKKQMALTGERYYRIRNDILNRKMYVYTERGLFEDPYSANNKIPNAFFKLIVDQKIHYLLGQNPTTDIDDKQFYKTLKSTAKKASYKGVQWVYVYVKDGELKIKLIPTEELYWVFEDEELTAIYRFVKEDGKNMMYEYLPEGINVYYRDMYLRSEAYMTKKTTIGAMTEEESVSWDFIPFIPLFNNEDGIYDLEPIKACIDMYDKCLSDFANNLEDFTDIYWVLKGYEGQDASAFLEQVRMYKTLKVGEGGDARAETIQIPHDAREVILDRLHKLIFTSGQGVDTTMIAGGSLTNVAIEAHFANLDMKATDFSEEVTAFINEYVKVYNKYAEMYGKEKLEEQDPTYNKTLIINVNESLDANSKQIGVVSDETRWDNHPWTDAATEEERMRGTFTITEGEEDATRQEE